MTQGYSLIPRLPHAERGNEPGDEANKDLPTIISGPNCSHFMSMVIN